MLQVDSPTCPHGVPRADDVAADSAADKDLPLRLRPVVY